MKNLSFGNYYIPTKPIKTISYSMYSIDVVIGNSQSILGLLSFCPLPVWFHSGSQFTTERRLKRHFLRTTREQTEIWTKQTRLLTKCNSNYYINTYCVYRYSYLVLFTPFYSSFSLCYLFKY
jgi:hypothetical protein